MNTRSCTQVSKSCVCQTCNEEHVNCSLGQCKMLQKGYSCKDIHSKNFHNPRCRQLVAARVGPPTMMLCGMCGHDVMKHVQ